MGMPAMMTLGKALFLRPWQREALASTPAKLTMPFYGSAKLSKQLLLK